ncbi:zinc knuckle CX2CX4HX4C containing protein [Tanacetum coccineum]|uniref:Zinc knuckle CX2CX4HX4C containing protein n=1 Tax=Tanacetum coccineum TaxID=301880 RepID=A0ABQ4YSW5_9ASTR
MFTCADSELSKKVVALRLIGLQCRGSVRCSCFFLRGTSMENKGELGIGEVNLGVVAAMSSTYVDIAATFGVPLKTIGDLDVLIKDIKVGKHEELLSGMTNDKRMAVMDTLSVMCDSIEVDNSPNDSIVQFVDIHDKPSSYVGAAEGSKLEPSKLKANFRSLFSKKLCEGANFSIPRKVVETVSTRFVNTLYGYFIGKRIAFPVVEYYVRNNWGKYGLARIMMNSKGFFFFQFKTSKGLEDVLENGPWMICNSPIILKKWTMNSHLCKEELTRIPPIMLDSYTSSMCIESWGRSSFARCLIEINANDVLKESLTMGVPLIDEPGFTIETVSIEYEWKPPCCDLCKIFGHVLDHCPKKVSVPSTKGKSKSTNGGQFDGYSVKQTVRYEPKAATSVPKKGVSKLVSTSKSPSMSKNQPPKVTVPSSKEDNIPMSNSYAALDEESDEDVENVYDESANLLHSTQIGGSSSTFTVAAG